MFHFQCKRIIFISCVLTLSISCFSTYCTSTEMASIKGDMVPLRTEPDPKAKSQWELGNGYPVEVLKKKGDWAFIRDFERDTGWIPRIQISKSPQVVVKANKNEEQAINIRKGPTLDSVVVGNAYYGVVFLLLQKRDGWVQVRHESGLTGWIKTEFLWGI